MSNLVLSIIYLILSFAFTLLIYKYFGKYGLISWMCILVVISNIQTIKIIDLYGYNISLGNISYGALFLTTDILTEKYGKISSNNAIKISFILMIFFTIFMYLFLKYKPSSVDFSNGAFNQIFSYIPRITIGSLLAYYISQRCDTFIYSLLKDKYNKVIISNNISTIISQIIDTLIFVIISFIGVISNKEMISLIITMLIIKWIIALLDTPFMLIAMKIKSKEI